MSDQVKTMNRKRYLGLGLLVLLAFAGLAYAVMHPTVTVRLSREEVQAKVDAKLPLRVTKLGVAYDVSRAVVDLRPDGRVAVDADVDASALNRTAKVALVGSGALAYRDGEFFLTGFKVERAVPRAVDPSLADEARPQGRLGAAIEALALKDRAAKALEAAGAEDGAAFLTARKDAVVAMAKAKGEGMLADALERRPVYRLKEDDVRQSLAKLALRDVRVEDGQLVAELNVMHALARILLYVVGIGLALAVVGGVALTSGGAGLAALLTLGALSN